MGIKDLLFGRRNSENLEYARTVAYAQLKNDSGSEQLEKELNLGIKDAIVLDKGAMAIYESETYDYIIKKDAEGNSKLEPVGPNYEGQAMRLFLSPKLGLGNIDKKEAQRELLLAEREMVNIEMNSKEYDYHLGKGSRFTAQLIHFRQLVLGSVEGKMMRNLLISPHITRVETGEIPKKKRGSLI